MNSHREPLLPSTSRQPSHRLSWLYRRLNLRPAEAKHVFLLALQAHLANAVFALGRNIGPVLFLEEVGAGGLTLVMFLCGLAVLAASPLLSWYSVGRRATDVNTLLTIGVAATFALLTTPLITPAPPWLRYTAAFGLYVAEDLLTTLLMMQSSALAQATLTAYDAKRLLGPIQLGASTGAMSAGLSAGPLVRALGAPAMALVQVGLLLLSLWPNAKIRRVEERHAGGGKGGGGKGGKGGGGKGGGGGAGDEGGRWWKSSLIASMGVWTFGIIFCKTIVEYQYNVVVSAECSADDMVSLTGYLYAAAGLLSSVINVAATASLLRSGGMLAATVASPGALLVGAGLVLAAPGAASTFAGRMLDLTMRWSLNNTVKSLLWIAVPVTEQQRAKPWIEGTIKKAGTSVTALAIAAALPLLGGAGNIESTRDLSLMSVALAFGCCVLCVRMVREYYSSMWSQVLRRELQLCERDEGVSALWANDGDDGPGGAVTDGGALPPLDESVRERVLHKLQHGPAHVQLYILRQMGSVLPDDEWAKFVDGWAALSPAVQVRVLKLCAKERHRLPDSRLVALLEAALEARAATGGTQPASPALGVRPAKDWRRTWGRPAAADGAAEVVAVAVLAVGERRLTEAQPLLAKLLESSQPRVRAAAAAALLRLGWGVGLGQLSAAAHQMLEQMAGVALGNYRPAPRSDAHSRYAPPRAGAALGGAAAVDALRAEVEAAQAEWERRIDDDGGAAGAAGLAVAAAVTLTRLRTELVAAERAAAALAAGDGGVSRKTTPPQAAMTAGEASRYKEVHCALEVLRWLPEEMVPADSLLMLLRHPAQGVREAALPLLRPSLCASPRLRDLVDAALALLHYAAAARRASKALRALCAEGGASVASLATARAMEKLRLLLRAATAPPPPLRVSTSASSAGGASAGAPSTGGGGGVGGVDAPLASSASGLLGFLVESIADEWLTPSEEAAARADELLGLCGETHEADASQELLDALLRLQARGVGCSGAALEAQLRAHALQLLHGLTVLAWVDRIDAALPPPMHAPLAALLGVPEWRATDVLRDLAAQYCAERLYLQRLRIVKLAMLCAPAREHVKVTTVGAAWRLLRSEDGKAQAAVLEVLDSVLPTQLKKIILPLLDASPAAEKVRGGRESFEELRAVRPNAPPPWMLGWFGAAASEPLGAALGALCDALARSYPAEQLPSSGGLLPRVVLLRETRLFRGLLALHVAALAQRTHERTVAPGARCCRAGESYVIVSGRARRVVASEDRRGATEYTAGDALNELGCVYAQLPPVHCEAVGAEDGGDGVRLLVLQHAATWPLVVHMPPKFALSLLRALVQMCPPPSQPGGGRQPSAKAITTLQEARRAITDAAADGARASAASAASCRPSELADESERTSTDADGDDAEAEAEAEAVAAALAAEGAAEGESTDAASDMMVGDERPEAHRVFTRLEKALLLREVKLLRYVDTEYLQSLAEIASERLVPNGTAVCEQGHATDGRLNVIAQGCLALTRARVASPDGAVASFRDEPPSPDAADADGANPEVLRHLRAGDSLGNTALIHDTVWPYTAYAVEDTWILSISRTELTDLLRGRGELAHSVLHGVYHSFARRLSQVVGQGRSVKREWLWQADVDKHTASPRADARPISGESPLEFKLGAHTFPWERSP